MSIIGLNYFNYNLKTMLSTTIFVKKKKEKNNRFIVNLCNLLWLDGK